MTNFHVLAITDSTDAMKNGTMNGLRRSEGVLWTTGDAITTAACNIDIHTK